MSTINPLTREMSAKIVYVGPGLSGKTTCLQHIHSRLGPERRGELVSLATDEDRTLFFDFLPVRVPKVNGMGVRLHLYTVPGQVFYAATRDLVLTGADGIVFVADAQEARMEANVQSLDSTKEHLEAHGIDFEKFPIVFQYNKRDLPETVGLEALRAQLNPTGRPEFETVATEGTGVLEALRQAVRDVISALSQRGAPVSSSSRREPEPASATGIAQRLANLAESGSPTASAPSGGSLAASGEGNSAVVRLGSKGADPRSKGFGDLPLMPRGSAASRASQVIALDEIAFVPEVMNPEEQEHVTTERPVAGVSFSELWDVSARAPIALIESCITASRYNDAVHHVASAVASLLARLPVPTDTDMGTRASLLGLDGTEYLRLCRLASQPAESISSADALFALYVLVAARVKLSAANAAM